MLGKKLSSFFLIIYEIKNEHMKNLIFISLLLSSLLYSKEDDLKRFRTSIDIGFPALAGLNVEYLVPIASNRVALNLGISYLPLNVGEFKVEDIDNKTSASGTLNYRLISFGGKYYLLDDGNGLFLGISYNNINFSSDVSDVEGTILAFGEGWPESVDVSNSDLSISDVNLNSVNLDIGYNWIFESGFFIGLEAGVGIIEGYEIEMNFNLENGESYIKNENAPEDFYIFPKAQLKFGLAF
jgi:hypothetical protein